VVVRDAFLLGLMASGVALAVNALRPTNRLPLVAREPHEILRPCPETSGHAEPLEPGALRTGEPGLVLLDARSAEEFLAWHLPGARSLSFDYLTPVSREQVKELLRLRPRRVVVYGDGDNPDSGEQMARQIAGLGLKQVHFVRGGAPALKGRRSGGRP
jgi:rhodanese-related sulfurtransferase